ncbi:MAG: DUF3108 domain-containing protein [Comamonadaceae bacterium]|nr:MAG: DUF3108 domain-containing protein [Comamonadaceae bacterium]
MLPTPRTTDSPPWRTLALLAALVVAAHALVLQLAPMRFGLAADGTPKAAPALVIRSIEAPPVDVVAAPAKALPAPVPKPRPKPRPKPQTPSPATLAPPPTQAVVEVPAPLEAPALSPEEALADAVAALPANSIAESSTVTGNGTQTATIDAPAPAASAPALVQAPPPRPVPTRVTAMTLPGSVQLKYKMNGEAKGLTYYANAELNWRTDGAAYDASMRVSALFLGSRSMASIGRVGEAGLVPQRFTDKSRSEVAAHFEADKGLVTFSANTPSAPWVEGAQDRVTVFLQLGGMLAANPAVFPPGTNISMYTVGPRSADMWTFQVEGDELLKLPYGELATVKVIRQPRRDYDQRVEIWYAPSLGFLPVRNRITQPNGDFVDQQLNSVDRP